MKPPFKINVGVFTLIREVGGALRALKGGYRYGNPDGDPLVEALAEEVIKLREEREKVASGKTTCADCNAILARW